MKEKFKEGINNISEIIMKVPVNEVPDWHFEAGSPLWEFGKEIKKISLLSNSTKIKLSNDVEALKENLKKQESPSFFNGPFINTEDIIFSENSIEIKTKETDLFSYITADYFFRNKQGENPVRPLAIQTTLFFPGGEKIILERKPKDISDMADKLSVFGSALKPGENNMEKAMSDRLHQKWGIEIKEQDLIPTGFCRENVNDIYCFLFMAELSSEQYIEKKKMAKELMRSGDKMFYEISTDRTSQSIEKILLGKRDISKWDPNGYFNILYALVARGLRTPKEIKELLNKIKEKDKEKFLEYKYPMEKYL